MQKLLTILFVSLFLFVAGSQPNVVVPYLEANNVSLSLDNLDLSFLGADLAAQVFLSGAQWHGTVASYDLHYALVTALHKQAGVRYMLLDAGYTSALVYNNYLQTGDIALLRMALDGIRYSNSSNDEHRLFWQRLYEYNHELRPEDKLVVIGIDIESQIDTALIYLDSIANNRFFSLFPVTEYLGYPEALARYVASIKQHYAQDPLSLKELFGEQLPCFESALANLAETAETHLSSDYSASREQVMYSNFMAAYNADPTGKFFAHLTMEHIYQKQVKTGALARADRLAMLLCQDSSPVQGVISFASLYRDSEFRFYYDRYLNFEVFNEFIDEPHILDKIALGNFTVFCLNRENSPFSWDTTSLINPTGGATTDYYQYILLIKNSSPTTPNLLLPAN